MNFLTYRSILSLSKNISPISKVNAAGVFFMYIFAPSTFFEFLVDDVFVERVAEVTLDLSEAT